MSLSCSCNDDYDRWWMPAEDMAPLATKRWRVCQSCEKKINVGDESLEIHRWKCPETDYEESRFGDEVPLTTLYLCAHCAEIAMNLNDKNFCFSYSDNMDDLLHEYWEMTGFDPNKYKERGA